MFEFEFPTWTAGRLHRVIDATHCAPSRPDGPRRDPFSRFVGSILRMEGPEGWRLSGRAAVQTRSGFQPDKSFINSVSIEKLKKSPRGVKRLS